MCIRDSFSSAQLADREMLSMVHRDKSVPFSEVLNSSAPVRSTFSSVSSFTTALDRVVSRRSQHSSFALLHWLSLKLE